MDVLRYDATYYVEELLAFLTRLILLFAPHAAFATRFVELHGDGMICDALNSEKSEAVMQNVANALCPVRIWTRDPNFGFTGHVEVSFCLDYNKRKHVYRTRHRKFGQNDAFAHGDPHFSRWS